MMRPLFVVLYDGAAWRSGPFQTATGQSLQDAISINVLSYNVQHEGDPQFATDPETYDLFSWHLQLLPRTARIAQVPRPGVVLAVHRETPDRIGSGSGGTHAVAILLRRELEQNRDVAEVFTSYLDTPAPRWPAVPLAERDVLVSHGAEDAAVVADLMKDLAGARLTCSAMERPSMSDSAGSEAWRSALASSVVLLSVVGPSSVESEAVLREAGAAWALGRAIVPALVGAPSDRLHNLMSGYQARKIETPEERAALATELAEFMVGAAGGMAD